MGDSLSHDASKSVKGCLVVTVIIEPVEVICGDWQGKDDIWGVGVVCIIVAGSSEHAELCSLILKHKIKPYSKTCFHITYR